jgi:hypothetical protein
MAITAIQGTGAGGADTMGIATGCAERRYSKSVQCGRRCSNSAGRAAFGALAATIPVQTKVLKASKIRWIRWQTFPREHFEPQGLFRVLSNCSVIQNPKAGSQLMAEPGPNFRRLGFSNRDVAVLIGAMLQAREAIERRSWSNAVESIDENWWMDVLADPRARVRYTRYGRPATQRGVYTLDDEPGPTISVACTKCSWHATSKLKLRYH